MTQAEVRRFSTRDLSGMYGRVLVPLDGSDLAEEALPYVEEIGRRLGSETLLVTACAPGDPKVRAYEAYLEKVATRLMAEGISTSGLCIQGDVASSLIEFSEKHKVGLVVISAHGNDSTGQWPLGSIANKVLQASRTPILLIRPRPVRKTGPIELARVLVPLDGSEFAENALQQALGLVRVYKKAEVLLVRVIEPVHIPSAPIYEPGKDYQLAKKTRMEREADRYLQRIEEGLGESGVAASRALLVGYPAETILQYAEDKAVDMMAVSTHGFSALTKWAFGSVASKLIEASTIPLLVHRPPLPRK